MSLPKQLHRDWGRLSFQSQMKLSAASDWALEGGADRHQMLVAVMLRVSSGGGGGGGAGGGGGGGGGGAGDGDGSGAYGRPARARSS